MPGLALRIAFVSSAFLGKGVELVESGGGVGDDADVVLDSGEGL